MIVVSLLAVSVSAQTPDASKNPFAKNPAVRPDEKSALEKALAETDLTQKIAALQKFIKGFPKSAERTRASEILVSTQAQLADEKLRAGSREEAIELFRSALANAPLPISDKLFSEILLQFPTNLFYGGETAAAFEISRLLEEKISANAKQLLGLATFYLGTENAVEAKRLAEKAIALDANLPAAYQALAMAHRIDFQLEESANAYAKALELDPASAVSKRSLAEMKRALGKADESATLYRELIEKNSEDTGARAGLTLALFDAGKTAEAEAELAKSLEQNPNNLSLLVGAAYWYAANRQAEKALEYAQRAATIEPRYTWARIALARAMMAQKNPNGAERELLAARQFGNFPTMDYEIAAARLSAGFYEEAARELKKSFTVKGDVLETKLGNRVAKESDNFIELLELERRASIFAPVSAESRESSAQLKALLRFDQAIENPESSETEISQTVREFINGNDAAKIHRQLYAARRLLEAKKNLPETLDLTQAAVRSVETAFDVPSPAAAIMADELFESRTLAISRNQVVVVPEVARQTLSAILRGRIEELAGWTLYQQGKPAEAVVRLKRAVSILPEKSAWWRSSTWRLGAALEASDRQPEALEMYVKSYNSSQQPDAVKYSVIEALYKQTKGSVEGLEQRIGARPASNITNPSSEATAQNAGTPSPIPNSTPVESASTTAAATEPSPTPAPTIEAATEIKTEATPSASPEPSPTAAAQDTEKLEVKVTDNTLKTTEKSDSPGVKPTPKPLFDPIVITVPKTESTLKKTKTTDQSKPSDESVAQTEIPQNSTSIDGSGETRSRISPSTNTSDSVATENPNCKLVSNQDSITILNQGGSLGIMLGFEGDGGDLAKITATSGSPADVGVTLDADIGKQSNRSFYIIKSISQKKGVFTVTFESTCGKKEIQVKVR